MMGLQRSGCRLACLLAVLALVCTGCSNGNPSADQGSSDASLTVTSTQDDRIAIYSAVVRQIALKDDTAGGKFPKPVIYILRVTDSTVGDPQWPRTESSTLSVTTQEGVTRTLSDLPARIESIAFDDAGWPSRLDVHALVTRRRRIARLI